MTREQARQSVRETYGKTSELAKSILNDPTSFCAQLLAEHERRYRRDVRKQVKQLTNKK